MFSKKIWKKIAPENMKKSPSKVAHNRPIFFSVLPTGPEPAQISIFVPWKLLTMRLMYNDFGMQMWSPWSICQILKKFSPFLARLETALEFRAEEAWN